MIYESFTRSWYFNELKRVSEDFQELLIDKWDVDVDENDIYNFSLVSKKCFSDFDDFNVYVCWYLLSKGKIIFSREELLSLIESKLHSEEELDLYL